MKKNLVCIALLASIVGLTACGTKNSEALPAKTEIATETPTETDTPAQEETEVATDTKTSDTGSSVGELSDDLYSYQISINGTVYQFPMSYNDFVASGWTYKGDVSEKIPSMVYTSSDWFYNGEDMLMTDFLNFGINEAPLSECYLGGINVEKNYMKGTGTKVLMPKGIELGVSVADDVKAAYGEPTSSYESDSFPTMTYEMDSYCLVEFGFDVANGGVLNSIDIKNFVEPEGFAQGEVDTAVPAIVEAYKAPTDLGDDLLKYTVEYAGNMYQLPAPVSEFINNGWKIVESDTETTIAGNNSGKVTMMKDNQTFWTYVTNYSANATSCENAFVTQLEANSNDCNVSMTVPKGISMGMTQADLEAALEGIDFTKSEESSYTDYEITDPASLTYGYDIIVRDGIITGIEAKYDPSYDEFTKAMGVQ